MLKHTTFNSVFALKQAHLFASVASGCASRHFTSLHLLVHHAVSCDGVGFGETVLHFFPCGSFLHLLLPRLFSVCLSDGRQEKKQGRRFNKTLSPTSDTAGN